MCDGLRFNRRALFGLSGEVALSTMTETVIRYKSRKQTPLLQPS
jgi:hypothetical protein